MTCNKKISVVLMLEGGFCLRPVVIQEIAIWCIDGEFAEVPPQ